MIKLTRRPSQLPNEKTHKAVSADLASQSGYPQSSSALAGRPKISAWLSQTLALALRRKSLQPAPLSENDLVAIQRHIKTFRTLPEFCVVMPVYNPKPVFLRMAIESVQRQIYPHWKLCIANDASTDAAIAPLLDAFAANDTRIKVIHRKQNGHISAATNSAIELVTSEFIALMDHDDLLHPTALYEVANVLQQQPETDVVYTDSDCVETNGRHFGPFYKPDFNIDLLLGQNVVSHLGVYRSALVRQLGGLRLGLEGSQDYDLILRAHDKCGASRIRHVPEVLYHWRRSRSHKSYSGIHMDRCFAAAKRAIQDHLDREAEGARVTHVPKLEYNTRVLRRVPQPPPLVSCIIPTRGHVKLLRNCMDGLLNNTEYRNIEVLIVDNGSVEPASQAYFEAITRADARVKLLRYPHEFNYSAINNFAAKHAAGSLLALINTRIEVRHKEWLNEMVSNAVRPGAGAVGAKLYYPHGRIQHAGFTIGLVGVAGHSHHLRRGSNPGYFSNAKLAGQVSAVSAACLVVSKRAFDEVGGFDEQNLPFAYSDVDLCLKLQKAGYRNIWTPFAELTLHESTSRNRNSTDDGRLPSQRERSYLHETWPEEIANDPFYNPNFSLRSPSHAFAVTSRRAKPWAAYLS